MARFNTLSVGKLKVDELVTTANKTKFSIVEAFVLPGENATTALSEDSRSNITDATDFVFLEQTVNAAPFQVVSAITDYKGLVTGVTVGNMATTDRFNAMVCRKGSNEKYVVVSGGRKTTTAGDTNSAFTIPGLLATDMAFACFHTTGTGARTVVKAVCTTNTLTVSANAAQTAAHVLDYIVIRPVGAGKPTHELVLLGSAALDAVGAGVADTITAAGVRSTDIVVCQPSAATEVDHYIKYCAPGSGVVNLTFDGAPGITTVSYAVFRAITNNG